MHQVITDAAGADRVKKTSETLISEKILIYFNLAFLNKENFRAPQNNLRSSKQLMKCKLGLKLPLRSSKPLSKFELHAFGTVPRVSKVIQLREIHLCEKKYRKNCQLR